jgi:hypothetical protein
MSDLSQLDYPTRPAYPARVPTFADDSVDLPLMRFVIELLRPKVFVELGAEHGVPYCASCQVVEELGLKTRYYSICSLKPGQQDDGVRAEILMKLQEYHDTLYEGLSQAVHYKFNDAPPDFEDGAIDLLHIRGQHSYDAIKDLFNRWLPRMSDEGIIGLSNMNVREIHRDGRQLWDEFKFLYPHLEVIYENDLGPVSSDLHKTLSIQCLISVREVDASLLNLVFRQLGRRLELQSHNEQRIKALTFAVEERELKISSLSAQVADRQGELESLSAEWEAHYKALLKRWGTANRKLVEDRERAIQSLSATLQKERERNQTIGDKLKVIKTQLTRILRSRASRWATRHPTVKAVLLEPVRRLLSRTPS